MYRLSKRGNDRLAEAISAPSPGGGRLPAFRSRCGIDNAWLTAGESLYIYTQFTYNERMKAIFIELPAFERHRDKYLDDERFRSLQLLLMADPEAGDVIPGAGGLRKARFGDPRREKESVEACESSITGGVVDPSSGYLRCTTRTRWTI